jgi:hypothetical protein
MQIVCVLAALHAFVVESTTAAKRIKVRSRLEFFNFSEERFRVKKFYVRGPEPIVRIIRIRETRYFSPTHCTRRVFVRVILVASPLVSPDDSALMRYAVRVKDFCRVFCDKAAVINTYAYNT